MNVTYKIEPTYPLYVINDYSSDFLSMVSYPSRHVLIHSATFNP
jgi:hypothetical protein